MIESLLMIDICCFRYYDDTVVNDQIVVDRDVDVIVFDWWSMMCSWWWSTRWCIRYEVLVNDDDKVVVNRDDTVDDVFDWSIMCVRDDTVYWMMLMIDKILMSCWINIDRL